MMRWVRWCAIMMLWLLTWTAAAQDSPIPLNFGTPYQGTATDAIRTEHVFSISEGTVVTIVLNSDDFDPVLQLEHNGQIVLISDDVGDSEDAAINNYPLAEAGQYTVAVYSYADRPYSGTYSLLLVSTSSDTGYHFVCPKSLPSRFDVGMTVQVPVEGTVRQMYANPTIHTERIGRVRIGDPVTILEGPECADDALWWRIQHEDESAWVIESGRADYWLVPYDPRANPELLMNGIGRSNNQPVTNGQFQVEYYCPSIGYGGFNQDNENWYCTNNRQRVYTLQQTDFDRICQETYNREDAFALQNGENSVPAYRWLCYAPGQ